MAGSTQRAFSKWQVDEDDSDGFNAAATAPTIEMAGGGIGGVAHGTGSLGSGHGFGLAGSTPAPTTNNNTLGLAPGNEIKTEFNKRLGGHLPRASTADFGSLPGPAGYGNIPEEEEGNSSSPRVSVRNVA